MEDNILFSASSILAGVFIGAVILILIFGARNATKETCGDDCKCSEENCDP